MVHAEPALLLGRQWIVFAILTLSGSIGEELQGNDEPCLPDAVPYESRTYFSLEGEDVPLGFWVLDWTSARLTAAVAKIIAKEVMGVHATTSGIGSESITSLYATAGCAHPEEYADVSQLGCSSDSYWTSRHHVGLEIWALSRLTAMRQWLQPLGLQHIVPEDGYVGYTGHEGMYVFEKDAHNAFLASSLPFEYYKLWDADYHEPFLYFDQMGQVDPNLLRLCNETSLTDSLEMENYLKHTGDEGGVIRDADTSLLRGRCWNSSWWVSPACRHDLAQCVPSITTLNWGLVDNIQRAAYFNMPVAFAVARSSSAWGQLGRAHRGPHYAYVPDDTFVDLAPSPMLFPPYNADEWATGKRTSMESTIRLGMVLWNRLQDLDPAVWHFLNSIAFSDSAVNALLLDAVENSSDADDVVACRWVRTHREAWSAWVLSATQCATGMGLVSESGSFLSELSDDALGCTFCPSGRYSSLIVENNTRVCRLCEPGAAQPSPLQSGCSACPPGSYAAIPGESECVVCEPGTYQQDASSTACRACPTPAFTRLYGAVSFSSCVCPPGTYEASRNEESMEMDCEPCPTGMFCPVDSRKVSLLDLVSLNFTSGLHDYPRVVEGYMTRPGEPLVVYKCTDNGMCPGDLPGTCAEGRDTNAVACGSCMSGKYEAGLAPSSCTSCSTGGFGTAVIGLIGPLMVIIGLVALVLVASTDKILEAHDTATCMVIAALTCTSLQTLVVLNNLEVAWREPIRSCMNIVSIAALEVKIFGVGCFTGEGARFYMYRQLIVPVFVLALALIALARKFCFQPSLDVATNISNAVGSFIMLLFISVVQQGVQPLNCYRHPHGALSMVSFPQILCFQDQDDDHLPMLLVGVATLVAVAGPFLSVVLWATVRYPIFVAQSKMNNGAQLRRFYFLFRRFKPQAYYYGGILLVRSLLICLVPITFRDDGVAQILVMSAVVCVFLAIQSTLRPWRGILANAVDTLVNLTMLMILLCGAFSLEHTDVSSSISAFAHVLLALFFGTLLGGCAVALWGRLRLGPLYRRFICHHKAAAAAQARLLQLLLQEKSGKPCFIDSDHLLHLDELFNTVRTKVGTLVVYLTKDVLKRPWCAGEITTAHRAKVRALQVWTQGFEKPSTSTLDEAFAYMDTVTNEFLEAGIIERDVARAFQWILCDSVQRVNVNAEIAGTKRFAHAADEILMDSSQVISGRINFDLVSALRAPHEDCILLSCDTNDQEAIAVAGILAFLLQEWAIGKATQGLFLMCDVECSMGMGDVGPGLAPCILPPEGVGIILILSASSLVSAQLTTIIAAEHMSSATFTPLPVCTPQFVFPVEGFYRHTLQHALGRDFLHAVETLQKFFRRISARITPAASLKILETEAEEIKDRMSYSVTSRFVGTPRAGLTSPLPTGLLPPSVKLWYSSQRSGADMTEESPSVTSANDVADGDIDDWVRIQI